MIAIDVPESLSKPVTPRAKAALETISALPRKPFFSAPCEAIILTAPLPARLSVPPVMAVTPKVMSPEATATAIGCAASKKMNSASIPASLK